MLHFSQCIAECCYAECSYAECPYAECRYPKCRYAEYRGAVYNATEVNLTQKLLFLRNKIVIFEQIDKTINILNNNIVVKRIVTSTCPL